MNKCINYLSLSLSLYLSLSLSLSISLSLSLSLCLFLTNINPNNASITSKSLENLFKILPTGVTSKNEVGACEILSINFWWRTRQDRIVKRTKMNWVIAKNNASMFVHVLFMIVYICLFTFVVNLIVYICLFLFVFELFFFRCLFLFAFFTSHCPSEINQ